MGCEPEIMLTVKHRKLEYFGHMRDNKYRILQNIIQGKVMDDEGLEEEFHGWLTCENGLEQHLLKCSDAQPIRSA